MKTKIKRLTAGIISAVLALNIGMPLLAQAQEANSTTLAVTITANGYWEKHNVYDWSINKTADRASLSVSSGNSATINYSIDATRNVINSSDVYGVAGVVSVTNTGFSPTSNMVITSRVKYKIGDSTYQTLSTTDVDTSVHPILDAGETYDYPYYTPFNPISAADYQSEVTVNIANDFMGFVQPDGNVTPLDFTLPSTPYELGIDEVASIMDSSSCSAGYTCSPPVNMWVLAGSQTVNYSVTVSNVSVTCDQYSTLDGLTILTGADTGEHKFVFSSANIYTGACQGQDGERHTIGYWKNHTGFSGNNGDLVTLYLPITLGNDLVVTASQAQAILSTMKSNGIDKLKAQLLAAKLNILSGAPSASVSTIVMDANNFLKTRNSSDWINLDNSQQQQVLEWMTALDNYNNGK